MTTITETPETTTTTKDVILLTLPAADLHNGLANAIHFASKDTSLPALNAVNLAYDPATRVLVARATDRYKMVYVKVAEELDGDYPKFEFTVRMDDVKNLIAILRGHKKFYDPLMQIEVQDDRAEFIYFADGLEKTEIVRIHDQSYPALGGIFTGVYEGRDHDLRFAPKNTVFDSQRMFNPEFIADIAKLKDHRLTPTQRRGDGLTLGTASKGGQLTFWLGEWAHGLVMPMNNRGEIAMPSSDQLPSWIS